MSATFFNRRQLMTSLAAVMSAVGAGSIDGPRGRCKSGDGGVRKLGRDGKPADGTQMITALITYNGLLYIAGQGANSNGPVGKDDIDSHTTKVMGERERAGRNRRRDHGQHFTAHRVSREHRLLRAHE